ncbi:MAG: hypothetical protein WCV99_08355 [Sterolibacterium sp.]
MRFSKETAMNWLRLQMLWLWLPRIGGLARLAKQQGVSGKWDGTWSKAELQLCHLFQGHLHAISRDAFNNYLSYLGKSGDTGRTPAPVWLKWSLAAAVVVESMAWSTALYPDLNRASADGSAAWYATLGVASVLGLALLYFMYQAGGQVYRNHVIRECRRHQAAGEPPAFQGRLAEIQAHQPQSGDAADPPHIQCLRRVGTETGTQSILVAAVLLAAAAGYSTLVHFKNQARFQTAEAVTMEVPATPALPADIALGMLFLATQMLAASVAYRHQLAAKQGKIAYASTLGYATYEEYFAHRDGWINHRAEYWLKQLQSAGENQDAVAGARPHHSFREFLFLTRQDEIKYDLQNIPHREVKRDLADSRVESLIARIAELKHRNQRAEAIALIQDLPEPEKSAVKARLASLAAPHPDEVARRVAERQELEKIL